MKIIIVEDNADLAALAVEFLNHGKHDCRVVTRNFASLLREDVWAGVDVAIIDVLLEDPGISGLDIARWLRDHAPSIRIVITTALPEQLTEETRQLADAIVPKGWVDPDELKRAVDGES